MKWENCKYYKANKYTFNLTDKINRIVLSNIDIYQHMENIKKLLQTTSTWNDEYKWPDGCYFIAGIWVYSDYIIKKPHDQWLITQQLKYMLIELIIK